MKYFKHILFSFFIIALFSNPFRLSADTVEDSVFNSTYEKFLYDNDIPIHYIDNRFHFDENVKLEDIIRFLDLLTLEQYIIANNIQNANTTRAYDGGPYRRNFIYVNYGNIEIVRDVVSPTRLVYDPSHPDGLRVGDMAGYVEYPNIDIASEMTDLINVARIYLEVLEECNLRNIDLPDKYGSK